MKLKALCFVLLVCVLAACWPSAARSRACCSSTYTITLLELYVPGALQRDPAIAQRIADRVAALNAALANSGANVRTQLVRVAMMDFGGRHGAELLGAVREDLRVAALRDEVGADLVGVWDDSGDSIAYAGDRDAPSSTEGFHVIGIVGSFPHVFSHELAHNLGVSHQDGICRTDDPAFRDIMALCDGAPFIPPIVEMFTSSSATYLGAPFGGPDQDAVAIINRTAPMVSTFR